MDKVCENAQDVLLQKLEEYGDSLLDQNDYEKRILNVKNRKRKKAKELNEDNFDGLTESDTKVKKRKKKKKKKQNLTDSIEESNVKIKTSVGNKSSLKGAKRHLQELKNELDLIKCESDKQLTSEKYCDSKDNSHKIGPSINTDEPEVIVFSNRWKKSKVLTDDTPGSTDDVESSSSNTVSSLKPAFQLEKARHEVRILGIKGFKGMKKKDAMVAYLVKLGAKHPKNRYYNYKEFQEKRKLELVKDKEQKELDRSLGYKVKSTKKDKMRKRDKNDVGVVDGQIGRYKDGVQYIKRDELKGLKYSNKKRRK